MFRKTESHLTDQASRPGAPPKPISSTPSIICADVEIEGAIKSAGTLQIDGQVNGDVNAKDLTVGVSGEVRGEVAAETLKVKGRIIGSICALDVILEAKGYIEGDIIHTSLAIEPTAHFEGVARRKEAPLKAKDEKAASSQPDKISKPPKPKPADKSQDPTRPATEELNE